jgi:hypothetical protein
MELEQLLKSSLTRVQAPPGILERKAPKPRRHYYLALVAAALAVFLLWPTERSLDIQPYLQQSAFTKTIHGESVRHVVMNDVDLFIASPKLHLRGGNARWIQFPCSKQICLAACKRCTQAALVAAMSRPPVYEPRP